MVSRFVWISGEYQNSRVVVSGCSFPMTPGFVVVVSRVPLTLRFSMTCMPSGSRANERVTAIEWPYRLRDKGSSRQIAGDAAVTRLERACGSCTSLRIEEQNLFQARLCR